ncbi:unnamed protein product [Allacma fusca]|uniref:Uncharacterized protein n=1 Tax=Allacma fusca TaxID=39272 RepID=A0A8J2K510_9HEXA|nr:unnamed protein product [Allacma fusca]
MQTRRVTTTIAATKLNCKKKYGRNAYFDQPDDKIDIPTSVDQIVTTCKASFHNICVTEWLMLTKSLTCPACDVVMTFAEMRKKHFKEVQESQDPLYRMTRLGIEDPVVAVAPASSASSASTVDAAKGDFRGGKIQPQVMQSDVLHNHVLTKCITYMYSGKSKLLEELENSEPDANDESDWGVAPPWSANLIDGSVKDEPIVFDMTPYHSRSTSSSQGSDSATHSTTESESHESIRCNSLDGNLAA